MLFFLVTRESNRLRSSIYSGSKVHTRNFFIGEPRSKPRTFLFNTDGLNCLLSLSTEMTKQQSNERL